MPTLNADTDLTVRAARMDDLDQWLPLWTGYNAFYGREGPTALAEHVTADRWAAFLSPEVPMWALVAERNGWLVGLAHYLFHLSTTSLAPSCYMQDLFTAAEIRGAGVGAALIEAVAERAGAAGSASVSWQTHHMNATARRLYDRVAAQSEFLIYRMAVG
ncbi:MAG: putative histone acetyltransferase [Alphaproteobacteria bacterium]|nr:putative histone acetyltransferase [Alphaproteobacteria bacterium]